MHHGFCTAAGKRRPAGERCNAKKHTVPQNCHLGDKLREGNTILVLSAQTHCHRHVKDLRKRGSAVTARFKAKTLIYLFVCLHYVKSTAFKDDIQMPFR